MKLYVLLVKVNKMSLHVSHMIFIKADLNFGNSTLLNQDCF